MKKVTASLILILITIYTNAQTGLDSSVTVNSLATPVSPSFLILDASPELINAPSTPKEFTLGIANAFGEAKGWPTNLAMEFTPYWWFNSGGRNVYHFLGLKYDTGNSNSEKKITGENYYSGLKFTGISIAFVKKDMIPDTIDLNQNIFSVGIRTNLIHVHLKSYIENLKSRLNEWHKKALAETSTEQDLLILEPDPEKRKKLQNELTNLKNTPSQKMADKIWSTMDEKPIFTCDIAAGLSNYKIGDTTWHYGRSGIWLTMASYLPLNLDTKSLNLSFLDILVSGRYLNDNYVKGDNGFIKSSNLLDIGWKINIEYSKFSLGFEAIYRRILNNGFGWEKREVGIINYKVTDNFYVTGTFGNDFGIRNNTLSQIGIKWGLGSEKIILPN